MMPLFNVRHTSNYSTGGIEITMLDVTCKYDRYRHASTVISFIAEMHSVISKCRLVAPSRFLPIWIPSRSHGVSSLHFLTIATRVKIQHDDLVCRLRLAALQIALNSSSLITIVHDICAVRTRVTCMEQSIECLSCFLANAPRVCIRISERSPAVDIAPALNIRHYIKLCIFPFIIAQIIRIM